MPDSPDLDAFCHDLNVECQTRDSLLFTLSIFGILYLMIQLFQSQGGPVWILCGIVLFLVLSNWIVPGFSRWRYRRHTCRRMARFCEEYGLESICLAKTVNGNPERHPALKLLQNPLFDEADVFLGKLNDRVGRIQLDALLGVLVVTTGAALWIRNTWPEQTALEWFLVAAAPLVVAPIAYLLHPWLNHLRKQRFRKTIHPLLEQYCEVRTESLQGLCRLVISRRAQFRQLARCIEETRRLTAYR